MNDQTEAEYLRRLTPAQIAEWLLVYRPGTYALCAEVMDVERMIAIYRRQA
jgi:hypothetical protein